MIFTAAWLFLSILVGFLAGWVVGKFGHHTPRALEGDKHLAAELARTNRMDLK